MLRRPLSSGFAAVVEFGFAMNTKCVPAVVVTDVPVVIVGADADSATAVTVTAVASASVSAVVPMSTTAPGRSQLRWIASKPYAVPEGDATRLTVVDAPPVAHCATIESPLVTSWRTA
jgi:hypothetical protein